MQLHLNLRKPKTFNSLLNENGNCFINCMTINIFYGFALLQIECNFCLWIGTAFCEIPQ